MPSFLAEMEPDAGRAKEDGEDPEATTFAVVTGGSGGSGWKIALKIAVTVAFVVWLAARVDFAQVIEVLRGLRWGIAFCAVCTALLAHLLNILRWRYCLLDRAHLVPLSHLAVSYINGIFVSQLLPSEYGGGEAIATV
jgi:uncharacterized membrane protein YbhN (UPF0104 family)